MPCKTSQSVMSIGKNSQEGVGGGGEGHKDILRGRMKGIFLLKTDVMIIISQPESPFIYTLASTYCLNKYIISVIW